MGEEVKQTRQTKTQTECIEGKKTMREIFGGVGGGDTGVSMAQG